jgi:Tfp pilus assembly protein PilO
MIAISIAIIFGFVYPSYLELETAKKFSTENTKESDDISKKLGNVKSLAEDLVKNSQNVNLIEAYLPKTPKEERIINSVNYLANAAGVLLIDIAIEKDKNNNVIPQMQAEIPITGQVDPSLATSAAPVVPIAPVELKSELKFLDVKISIAGEYDKIQMFVDSIQKSDEYNEAFQYKIARNKETETTTATGEKKVVDPAILLAEINMKSGFSAFSKNVKSTNLKTESEKNDFSVLKKIQDNISQKSPIIEAKSSGKNNPFLP